MLIIIVVLITVIPAMTLIKIIMAGQEIHMCTSSDLPTLDDLPHQHAWARWKAMIAIIRQATLAQKWLVLCRPNNARGFDNMMLRECPRREILEGRVMGGGGGEAVVLGCVE